MSIQKVYNNENKIIANKSVVDHNQLANRDQYGAHSIGSIRKLPEKLTSLKEKDKELSGLIKENADNIKTNSDKILEVETNSKKIDIVENEDSTFTFTNYEGNEKTIQSGFLPDDDTLQLKDNKMALKKVYTSESLTGDGTKESPLDTTIKTDNTTITVENNKYVIKALYFPESAEDSVFNNPITSLDIENYAQNTNTKIAQLNHREEEQDLEISNIKDENAKQGNNIRELQSRVKGIGGYLNAYDFGKPNPSQDELTDYALSQIPDITKSQIFNQTKVKNLNDSNIWVLTNTPDSTPPVFEWANVGTEYINIANNNGVQGIVTGSYEELEGFIDINGHITINGLEEQLEDKASLSNENTFTNKNTFKQETQFGGVTEHNKEVKINDASLKVTNTTEDRVTQYNSNKITIEENNNNPYDILLPKKAGILALQSDLPDVQVDNLTISRNSDNEIQTVAVKDIETSTILTSNNLRNQCFRKVYYEE